MRAFELVQSGFGADVVALVVKVSLVLLVAATVTMCMRRASAARRHFVWSVAISGCLALALLQAVVPPIALRVSATSKSGRVLRALLPVGARSAAQLLKQGVQSHAVVASEELGAVSRSETLRRTADEGLGSVLRSETFPRTGDGATATSRDELIPLSATNEIGITSWQRVLDAIEHVSLAAILIALWSLGAIAVLLRLAAAHVRLSWIVRTSRDITDATWQTQLAQASAQLQNARSVRLLAHANVTTPFTAGCFRPAIIVPESSATWDANRRQAVLMHELAHVARGDYLALIVATVTCALFWFHPGVWYAARKLRNESESAADDCVVTRGVPAVQYATHLLALADRTHAGIRTPQIALGMARISQLEWRLRAMLDERRSRVAVSRLARRASGVAALLVLAPLAGLRAEAFDALGSEQRSETLHAKSAVAMATVPRAKQLGTLPGVVLGSVSRTETLPIERTVALVPTESAKQFDVPVAAARVLDVRSIADTVFDKTVAVVDTVALAMKWETGGHLTINEWDEPSFRLRATFGGDRATLGRVTLEQRADSVIVHSYFSDGSRGPYKDASFEIWVPRRARTNNYGSWAGSGSFTINHRGQSAAPPRYEITGYEEFSIPKSPQKGENDTFTFSVPKSPQKYDSVRLDLVKQPLAKPRVDTTIYQTIPAIDGKRLLLELPFGGDVIVHGWDNPLARLVATLKGNFWGGTRIMFSHVGEDVRLQTFSVDSGLRARLDGIGEPTAVVPLNTVRLPAVSNRFELWVPRKTSVMLSSRGGAFKVIHCDSELQSSNNSCAP